MTAINMIGKSTSEVEPIAKDETRVEEEKPAPTEQYVKKCLCLLGAVKWSSVPGTMFELVISQALHGCQLYGLSGRCGDADRVYPYPWWGSQQGLI
jgi:hypothetical protein